jgi:hypothetical protein
MRVDAFAIRLRPRANFEAADLGVRLCQSASRDVFSCYMAVFLPLTAVAFACYEIAPWLPALVLWWCKPWLDRTILFALSRAAFGQQTRPADVWREQSQVLWGQLLRTLTTRRLSMWRSFTQPVYQLEGLRGAELRARLRQIRKGRTRAGTGILSAFSCAETCVSIALMSLVVWFSPRDAGVRLTDLFNMGDTPHWLDLLFSLSYFLTVGFVEPCFVAAGFALYLSRRAELEAWDIEQELRRAFAR